jgi:hypothetical protein
VTSLILLVLAFGAAFFATFVSRIAGLGVVLTVGYFYGIVRANIPEGISHFLFDAAVVGYYTALVGGCWPKTPESPSQKVLRQWFLALVGWTVVMFLIPMQHFLIQLVGLRANCFLLPFLLVGSRLESRETERLALWLAVLNLVAIGFAIAEYAMGVPAFYPENSVTRIIYDSHVTGGLRIPATFANAHSFGGTMVATLPWLLAVWVQKQQSLRFRIVLMAAILAAIVGVFMSSTRTSVISLALIILLATLSGKMPPIFQIVWILLLGGAAYIVFNDDRLQRFMTLFDTEQVVERINGSVNASLIELICNYPLGNGIGAGGTSLPYFLTYLVQNPIVLESEYARIVLELGIPGLLLWTAFIGWFAYNRPRDAQDRWLFCRQLLWAATLFQFLNGFLGIGMFTAVPQSALCFLGIGFAMTRPAAKPSRRKNRISSDAQERTIQSSGAGVAVHVGATLKSAAVDGAAS